MNLEPFVNQLGLHVSGKQSDNFQQLKEWVAANDLDEDKYSVYNVAELWWIGLTKFFFTNPFNIPAEKMSYLEENLQLELYRLSEVLFGLKVDLQSFQSSMLKTL